MIFRGNYQRKNEYSFIIRINDLKLNTRTDFLLDTIELMLDCELINFFKISFGIIKFSRMYQ